MKRINEQAALHLAAAAFGKIDVPVGIHDLSLGQVLLQFPQGASVERAPGSEGDGRTVVSNTPKLTLEAALFFIEQSGMTGEEHYELWCQCIRVANETKVKADQLMPLEARMALADTYKKLDAGHKYTEKTPAKRLGVSGIDISVRRASARELDTSRMVRHGV